MGGLNASGTDGGNTFTDGRAPPEGGTGGENACTDGGAPPEGGTGGTSEFVDGGTPPEGEGESVALTVIRREASTATS